MADHFVYIITPEGADCPLNIGVSPQPATRLATFQFGSPVFLLLAHAHRCDNWDYAFDVMWRFHAEFEGSRGHGDWFHMPLHAAVRWFDECIPPQWPDHG